jgi:hypothetical protein
MKMTFFTFMLFSVTTLVVLSATPLQANPYQWFLDWRNPICVPIKQVPEVGDMLLGEYGCKTLEANWHAVHMACSFEFKYRVASIFSKKKDCEWTVTEIKSGK